MTIDCDDVREWSVLGLPLDRRRQDHRARCARCQAEAPELLAIAAALGADAPEPPRSLAAQVLQAAAPLLERNAERAWWRQSARALVAALVPLPLVVIANVAFMRLVYGWLTTLLPPGVSLFLLFNYAAMLALLSAAIYGAIPLIAARQAGFTREVRHG